MASVLLIAVGTVVARCALLVSFAAVRAAGTWVYLSDRRSALAKRVAGRLLCVHLDERKAAAGCVITGADLDGRAGQLLSLALIAWTGRRRTVGSDLMRGRGLETPRLLIGADDRDSGHARI